MPSKGIEAPVAGATEEQRAAYLALLPHPSIWGWHYCPGPHNPLVAIHGSMSYCLDCKPIDWGIVRREAERLEAGYAA